MTRFTPKEKQYLLKLVQVSKKHYTKEQRTRFVDIWPRERKGAHQYKHFLEDLVKKLKTWQPGKKRR